MLQTKIALIQIDKFGFCRINLDSTHHDVLDKELARELCDAIVGVCDGTPRKFLTDSSDVEGHVSIGAREIIRNHAGMIVVRQAEAFVVNSLPTRLIANFYMKFNKPPNPTKIFNTVEKAEEWLHGVQV